ncbi:hypothetical protein ES288_D07G110300v1 [Gossypium darwinii]|uniref:Uncharacterized protein n=1 Tax=Gossypium darwinii TaxID=34276 RepID=A0A5D2BUN3_GOSDA|nr:hypothetical protein ES288_D07G110300v1 [Gossypium darwinii]
MFEFSNYVLPNLKIRPLNQSDSNPSTWFSFGVFCCCCCSFCIFCVVIGVNFLVVKGVVRMCLWWRW